MTAPNLWALHGRRTMLPGGDFWASLLLSWASLTVRAASNQIRLSRRTLTSHDMAAQRARRIRRKLARGRARAAFSCCSTQAQSSWYSSAFCAHGPITSLAMCASCSRSRRDAPHVSRGHQENALGAGQTRPPGPKDAEHFRSSGVTS